MQYFTHKGQKLSKIGIGTWGIGGYMERDTSIDEGRQTDALAYMLDQGMNFTEANMWYSEGYSVELLSKALNKSGKKREDIFVCQAIYLKDGKDFKTSQKELHQVMDLFETDYVDSIQFSMGSFLRASYPEITEWLQELLESQKINYINITNESLEFLEKYHKTFGDKLFSHEVPYSLEVREAEREGMIPYARENDILTVAFQPLRRNRTAKRNWPLLIELAEKYGKTQNQIILNWISSKGFLPINKSETVAHIDENIAAIEFEMEAEDLHRLNDFTPPGYIPPKVDWKRTGDGYTLDQFPNMFDEEYNKQTK